MVIFLLSILKNTLYINTYIKSTLFTQTGQIDFIFPVAFSWFFLKQFK